MKRLIFLILFSLSTLGQHGLYAESSNPSSQCITSAEQYLAYLQSIGQYPEFSPPETVIVVYSHSLLESILSSHPHQKGTGFLSDLYWIDDGKIAVLINGFGSPALGHKMEELIAFGVKNFIAVGSAGSLSHELNPGDFVICAKALGEDGISHLYLQKKSFAISSPNLMQVWASSHPDWTPVASWSFPAFFRETHEDVVRVTKLGCQTVEMEAAALYAIAEEKNVEALALFVISDSLADGKWNPQVKDARVKNNMKKLADEAISFAQTRSSAAIEPAAQTSPTH